MATDIFEKRLQNFGAGLKGKDAVLLLDNSSSHLVVFRGILLEGEGDFLGFKLRWISFYFFCLRT